MADDRFGNIKIDGGSNSGEEHADITPSDGKKKREPLSSSRLYPPLAWGEEKSIRHRPRRGTSFWIPLPPARVIAWFSLIPLLVGLYGVGSYFLVPMVIKGVLAEKIARHIDRPVEVGRTIFSPFNLELLVNDVTVGPVRGDLAGGKLLVTKKTHLRFSLARIFKGKVICREALLDGIEVNLVRNKDSIMDLKGMAEFFLADAGKQEGRFWPAWFVLQGITVRNGQIHVDDRQAKKVFNIDRIQLHLPAGKTGEEGGPPQPQLRAFIDSSPIEVNGERFRSQSGDWRTGFSFAFNKVIMANFKDLLPLPDTGLELTEGEADILLHIVMPEKQQGFKGILVEGEAKLDGVKWHDPRVESDLTVPEVRILYHVVPGDKLIRLTRVEFAKPELRFPEKNNTAVGILQSPAKYVHSIVHRIAAADEIMELQNFLLHDGRILISRVAPDRQTIELNDVAFEMKGLTTAGFRREHTAEPAAATYSFKARDITGKTPAEIFSEGQMNGQGGLSGKLELTGLDLSLYQGLLPASFITLQKGTAYISLLFENRSDESGANDGLVNHYRLHDGMFTATGFVLVQQGKKALAGKKLICRKFTFDMPARKLVCDQVELQGSDIFVDSLLGRKEASGAGEKTGWEFRMNGLQVSGSALNISITGSSGTKKTKTLVLRNVSIKAGNLQAENPGDNVKASAGIGKKGKLSVSGSYSPQADRGALRLNIMDMELPLLQPYYSTWLVPKINKGTLSAKGNLLLPAREFSGSAYVDNLEAGTGSGARIKLRRVFSDSVLFHQARPSSVELGDLVVQQPFLNPGLSNGDPPLEKYLRLKNRTLPSSVRIERIFVNEGQYKMSEPVIYRGYQPMLKNISGMLKLVDNADQPFSIKGAINGQGTFAMQGKLKAGRLQSYDLTVQGFPLLSFEPVLKKEAGLSGQAPLASWAQTVTVDANVSRTSTEIHVQNVMPDNSHPSILPLIIDADRSLEMTLGGEYPVGRQKPFLFEQLINRLRRLEVKASISPMLAMQTALPDLTLPGNIAFAPGTAVPENTQSLSGYRVLLQKRPFASLGLQGHYDPAADKDALQRTLQKEADRQRDVENTRRALERAKILQEEEQRKKDEKTVETPGVVTEEILVDDVNEQLQPLPRIKVEVNLSQLEDLARQRALAVREYLVNFQQLDPARVIVAKDVSKDAARVEVQVLPYNPPDRTVE